LTTYTDVQANDVLQREFPMLCQAASETGGLAIQNRGTLGGNIINASPAADSPPALLAYDAEIELISRGSSRWIAYDGFHTGYKQMTMRSDELLARIRLPRSTATLKHYYRKVGTRKAQAISKVCFAGVAQVEGARVTEARIVLGSVAPVVLRCKQTEDAIRGHELNDETMKLARETLMREISPIDDVRSTADYRLRVAANLLVDFLVTSRS
jgi:CO/xanthine dehydrogenase FAD-binding subunit